MAPGSCPARPCCAGTLGVWNIPPPAANLCSHPTCQHGLDLLPGKPGRLVLLPVPHRGQEAKTPQPWGLGKLGVGMVLQGGPTHSVSPSLSLSQGLRVLQGMCRALGCCSLTLAQAAWSLVSCGRTKHGPGGQGAGESVGHSQVCTWDRRRPSPHWPAGGDSLSHTHTHTQPQKAPGPWQLWAQGQVPETKARSGWGKLCNPALSWASSLGQYQVLMGLPWWLRW